MNDRARTDWHDSPADVRHPIRLLVVSVDASFVDAVTTCCCTLTMSVRPTRDLNEAATSLVLGESELAILDAGIGLQKVIGFVNRLRLELCADWVPLIVAGEPGRIRPSLWQTAPGMIDGVIGKPLVHDELHERLVAARRAVSLRRAFESTLDRVSEAVVVIDEGGRVRTFNAAAQHLFQWKASDMLGASVDRLMPDRVRSEHGGYVARYQSTGQAHVIGKGRIETGQRRDGSQFPMHLTVSDISDANGTRFVGVVRDLTRDREAEDLRQRALSDPLTGLANAAHAHEQLRDACNRADGAGAGIAVIYIDLDRFKPVNDEHGHAVGDKVLKTVAHRMTHNVGSGDLVARMGGDEFLVVLRDVSRSVTAEAVARRLQASITQPIVVGSRTVTIGASAGVAVHGIDGTSPESLLQAADQAMYERKRRGTPGPGVARR